MRRVSSFAGRSKNFRPMGRRPTTFLNCRQPQTMASKASMLKRRTAAGSFELASKVKDVDPELVDLIEKMEKYEKEIVSAKKALEPFAGETRKYCDVLETAALQGWKLSPRLRTARLQTTLKPKLAKCNRQ